jgi:tyrosine-protein phosphatase SIW14
MISLHSSTYRALLVLCGLPGVLPGVLPAAADVPGVGNFHQINNQVYRGAQPTKEGFANLAHLGIATVIDLREPGERSDKEAEVVKATGMRYISVPMKGLSAPAPEDVAKVLSVLNDLSAGPVFVHCRRGADRTGTVLACYRISHDGWDNRKALTEAKSFGMAWIERAMQSYVLHYATGPAPAKPVASQIATTQ